MEGAWYIQALLSCMFMTKKISGRDDIESVRLIAKHFMHIEDVVDQFDTIDADAWQIQTVQDNIHNFVNSGACTVENVLDTLLKKSEILNRKRTSRYCIMASLRNLIETFSIQLFTSYSDNNLADWIIKYVDYLYPRRCLISMYGWENIVKALIKKLNSFSTYSLLEARVRRLAKDCVYQLHRRNSPEEPFAEWVIRYALLEDDFSMINMFYFNLTPKYWFEMITVTLQTIEVLQEKHWKLIHKAMLIGPFYEYFHIMGTHDRQYITCILSKLRDTTCFGDRISRKKCPVTYACYPPSGRLNYCSVIQKVYYDAAILQNDEFDSYREVKSSQMWQ